MPEPAEPVEDRPQRLGDVALGVGVVDAQQKLPAVTPGEQPVEQGRADPANVKIAGGAWARKRVRTVMRCRGRL